MPENEDLYEILQVHPSAQPEIIQAAYRRLAQMYHPDVNSSPDADEMMAHVNWAYEVLNDPAKRAAYDRSKGKLRPASRGSSQNDEPTAAARSRSRRPTLDYFTIGSNKADVAILQGPPDDTRSHENFPDEEVWGYLDGQFLDGDAYVDAYSTIIFGKSRRVVGWMNRGRLKVRMIPDAKVTTAAFFSIGSHKDDVVRLQGTPVQVTVPSRYVLTREERAFDREMASINREFGLKVKDEEDIDDNISGLNDDDHREIWRYHNGTVEFSTDTTRVTAWQGTDGVFNVPRGVHSPRVPGASYGRRSKGRWVYEVRSPSASEASYSGLFALESSKNEVLRLQGEPQSKLVRHVYGEEDWFYQGGTVKFDAEIGQVIYWENRDGSLKTRGIRPDVSKYNFEQGRRRRIDAWRHRKEGETNQFALKGILGCLGVIVAFVLLVSLCGADLL